jgi:hypothetical protein
LKGRTFEGSKVKVCFHPAKVFIAKPEVILDNSHLTLTNDIHKTIEKLVRK